MKHLPTSLLVGALLATACVPPPAEDAAAPDLSASTDGPVLDEAMATYLAALPLACLDRPHGAPTGTGYLFERSVALRLDYEVTPLHAKFVFRNPNETDACGCGESVTIVPASAAQM